MYIKGTYSYTCLHYTLMLRYGSSTRQRVNIVCMDVLNFHCYENNSIDRTEGGYKKHGGDFDSGTAVLVSVCLLGSHLCTASAS